MLSRPARPGYLIPVLVTVALVLLATDRIAELQPLHAATGVLYQWLMLLGGVALILGVANAAWLHLRRIQLGQQDWILSLVLLAVMVAVFTAGVLGPAGINSPLASWIFASVVAPGQAALFALLAFFMAAAAYRFLRIGRSGGAWLLAGALLILLVEAPIANGWLPETLVAATYWLVDEPMMAALRGALLGSGIALLVVGLRLLVRKV